MTDETASDPSHVVTDAESEEAPTSSDLFDPDKFFLEHLNRGFASLIRDESFNNSSQDRTQELLSQVVVNFVDPTSSSGSLVSGATKQPLELYQKLTTVFEREYQNRLTSVPFQNFRSGAAGVIERLVVHPTHSHVGMLATLPVDASEWHTEPYCHVYIAAVENLEHYRTTVKPSIQIVLSQLEAAAAAVDINNSSSSKDPPGLTPGTAATAQAAKHKPHYMIVFVPATTDKKTATTTTSAEDHTTTQQPRSRVAAFASRMAAARQSARQRMSSTGESAAAAAAAATDSEEMATEESAPAVTSSTAGAVVLSKLEREILRRLTADFPDGRVCTLSGLDNDEAAADAHEWEVFAQQLGATVVDGFYDRCRRYDEELKRLGAKRVTAREWKEALGEDTKTAAVFDLTHFVLVKESFAFTYEQMRQYSEALLQYEELQAVLPDMQGEYFLKATEEALSTRNRKSFLQICVQGDALAFRARMQSFNDFRAIVHEIDHYLLVRETAQSFGMKNPVGVLKRCLVFVQKMYDWKRKQLIDSGQTASMLELNKWAFEFCWDVKTASRTFSTTDLAQEDKWRETFARSVCDILDFARFRFCDLGKLQFPDYKISQFLGSERLPPELDTRWEPWEEPQSLSSSGSTNGDFGIPESSILANALSSQDNFEAVYASLIKVLAVYMESCGRRRYAACLKLAVVDIAVRRNQLHLAEGELESIANTYSTDSWNACSFFLLFQLAKLRRKTESAATYLETLVRCFSASASPSKALATLFDDLEAVVCSPFTKGTILESAPIFEPILGLEDFSMVKIVGSDRNLLKKVYSVGETVPITISLTSQLPRDIKANRISVSLVPFQAYVAAIEDLTEIKAEDTFQRLSLNEPTIQPGRNDLVVEWIPSATGQFIVSGTVMQWEQCRFTYAAKDMNRPTVRVDVIPCEPTQSIDIIPKFLVPGQVQPVDIVFMTGKDFVYRGSVQLVGSSGVLLCNVDDNRESTSAWGSMMTLDLPNCTAGETKILRVLVKSEVDKETGGAAALHAQAITVFGPQAPDSESKRETGDGMECSLEASVTTLGRAAFVVDSSDVASYRADGLVISVSLKCNLPTAFILQKWEANLPDFLSVVRDGDLNGSLVNSIVSKGESLCLAFDCRARSELPSTFEGSLSITYDNGEGTSFTDSLTLNLKRPEFQPIQQAEAEEVLIEISPCPLAGLVGAPVELTCSIDTSALTSLRGSEIRYTIHCEPNSWVLHGKTEGVLPSKDSGNYHLSFIGIPTRPGSIAEYLVVSLMVEDGKRLSKLPVKMTRPAFEAFDPPKHTAVAFLISNPSVASF